MPVEKADRALVGTRCKQYLLLKERTLDFRRQENGAGCAPRDAPHRSPARCRRSPRASPHDPTGEPHESQDQPPRRIRRQAGQQEPQQHGSHLYPGNQPLRRHLGARLRGAGGSPATALRDFPWFAANQDSALPQCASSNFHLFLKYPFRTGPSPCMPAMACAWCRFLAGKCQNSQCVVLASNGRREVGADAPGAQHPLPRGIRPASGPCSSESVRRRASPFVLTRSATMQERRFRACFGNAPPRVRSSSRQSPHQSSN